jgi:hypothetical protein
MSKPYSPKVDRQIARKILRQGLYEEAKAETTEAYDRYLENQARKAEKKRRKNRRKDWDDDS